MSLRLGFIGLAALAVVSFWAGGTLSSQNLVHSVKPFTAKTKLVAHGAVQGTADQVQESIYARKSNRSFVQRSAETAPDQSVTGEFVTMYDTLENKVVMLEPFTKSKSTFIYTPIEFLAILNTLETENCSSQETIGGAAISEHRLNHSVWHTVDESPIAGTSDLEKNQKWKHERWTDKDLGCFPIRTIDSRSDGAVTESSVEWVREGPPADDLFFISTDYKERAPLEMEREFVHKFPGHDFWGDLTARSLEKKYQRGRSRLNKKVLR